MKKKITVLLLLINITVFGQCYQEIYSGGQYTIGKQNDGTLFAWGRNLEGQLGNGTTTGTNTPTQINSAINNNWDKIDTGLFHVLAVKTDGTLWAWGDNSNGQLGNNSTKSSSIPIQIGTDTDWKNVSAGQQFSIAVKKNGTLWAWGYNFFNQLGDGSTINKYIPTKIGTDNDWNMISTGFQHSLALKSDGSLWSWGSNSDGQIGDATTTDKSIPTKIGNENNWQDIRAGLLHSIALKTNGTLWSWGNSSNGRLGRPVTTSNKRFPNQIGTDNDWQTISAGGSFCMAIKTNGTLWAWGENLYGSLGTGNNNAVYSPLQIGLETDWTNISCGNLHSASLKNNGIVLWGWNAEGQIGDGTSNNKLVPTVINSCALSIDEPNKNSSIILYPNPTNNYLYISTNYDTDIEKIKILDIDGKVLLEENKQFSNIDLTSFQSGIYFLNIYTKKSFLIYKILKK
jgi:alpha-tubulin suppressor-like RCC1 family protein